MLRALVLVLILLVGNGPLSAQSLPDNTCPQIEITVPNGKNTSAGVMHYISSSTRDLNLDLESLKYKWTLPEGFPFEGQGKPYISFFVTDAMDGREVEVSLEVEGLPGNCPSASTATFTIGINPGSPILLDDYENLPINKERSRLVTVVDELKRLKDAKAIIIINYKRTDSEMIVKRRAARIVSVLSGKHKLPLDSFAFVFAETGFPDTRIYAWRHEWPAGVYSAANYQEFKVKR
jgi:hypothetical protein